MHYSIKQLEMNFQEVTQLGIQLSLFQKLDEVELNNHDVSNMKSSMLDRWLKINPEASWKEGVPIRWTGPLDWTTGLNSRVQTHAHNDAWAHVSTDFIVSQR